MKSLTSTLLLLTAFATVLTAQTALDTLPQSPPSTQARVETLKTRHSEALAVVVGGIARIADDPSLLGSKETIDMLERGDKEMQRSRAASLAILTTLRTETAAIRADSAFSDAQKDELTISAQTLASECEAVRTKAAVTIERLASAYKEIARWKKIFKSYANIRGEKEARKVLKTVVGDYVKDLTAKPATPDTEPSAR